jgi:hypothetical protein
MFTYSSGQGIRYKLELVGVQEVKWEKGVTVKVEKLSEFFLKK